MSVILSLPVTLYLYCPLSSRYFSLFFFPHVLTEVHLAHFVQIPVFLHIVNLDAFSLTEVQAWKYYISPELGVSNNEFHCLEYEYYRLQDDPRILPVVISVLPNWIILCDKQFLAIYLLPITLQA